ncbi:LuxR family transcriptional regulator [Paracoccus sp. JM45]|uniref:helix-turn-helix transcriptional regulator n=1 Tax=Paracoccus sp. JM45 TaxID=2283626 RepID=UPI000E6CA8AA|nr:LuxR family transcriptional regulator [Paracoccus sp. JM45]RJE81625.1 LuxR family transcriptional regulator [Paracoccus sp. JM45]
MTDFVSALVQSSNVANARDVFLQAASDAGFAHAFYAGRFMLTVPRSLVRESPVTFSNLPQALIDDSQNLYGLERDGWVDWVLRNDGDISGRDLINTIGEERSPSLAMGVKHGLHAVQIISLRNTAMHSVGAVILVPGKDVSHDDLADLWVEQGDHMRLLSQILHLRIATLPRETAPVSLTSRQREVLSWRSAGKTVNEIGTILGITPATVEKHMRLAREALGVESTPQAVLKAHVMHQLFEPASLPLTLHLPTG